MRKCLRIAASLGVAVLMVGCERAERGAAPVSSEALPAGLFASVPSDGALSIVEAKSGARAGETVVVRGRIGGSVSPFVSGRAMFTIVDGSMLACSDTPGDGCTTPWDYCCEPAADIARHAATVRVVGDDGEPLRASLKGQGGLGELATVLVRGKVAQNDGMVLVLDAEEITTVR